MDNVFTEKIYCIGHKSPDTDTVVSAIAMATFLNLREQTHRYTSAVSGKLNTETEFVLSHFKTEAPQLLENAAGKKLFLVDHNEATQMVDGAQVENIMGFVDHHKIKFENSAPIEIHTRPWGSTNTVIFDLFEKEHINIPPNIQGMMLCAILSDTVILKSPTTSMTDVDVANRLAEDLKVDFEKLGMDMFKEKAQFSKKSAKEILQNDFKDFQFKSGKFGVGQIEMPDLGELEPKIPQLKSLMEEMHKQGYHTLILIMTDVVQEGSRLLVVSKDEDKIAKLFKTKLENNMTDFLPGMMSRKKQVIPPLSEHF